MREVLFKAKNQAGKWVEGFYIKKTSFNSEKGYPQYEGQKSFIYNACYGFVMVDDSTVCQFTGYYDRDNNRIFEHDILEFEDVGEEGYEYKEGYDYTNRARAAFEGGRWILTDFLDDNSGVMEDTDDPEEMHGFWSCCKVVGNNFDNPELLKI